MGLLRQQARMCLAFSASCFCAVGYQIATAIYYQAESVAVAADALRWQGVFIALFFPAFFLCAACYVKQQRLQPWFALILALFGALMIGNLLSPYSLRFDSLEHAPPLRLPWGETLARFSGKAGAGNFIEHLAGSIILLWVLWRTTEHYREGRRRQALLLGGCVALILAASLWGWLIDAGVVDSFYVAGFAFLGFTVLKNVGAAIELRDHAEGQISANARLREEMAYREKTERILQQLREGVSVQTGRAFFEHLVKSLALNFSADYAFIGLIESPSQDRVATLAIWARGALAENMNYSLAHTPCAAVAGQCTRIYAQGVCERFPNDALARAWGLESYVGAPIFDSDRRPLGIVVVADTKPLQDADRVANILEIFAARAAAEVLRLRAEVERAAAESALLHSHALLQTLTEAQQGFLLEGDTQATFERLLAPLLDLTGSQYGFIGEVLYDDSRQPYLKTHVYSKVPWDSASRQLYEDAQAKGLEFHNLHSLIGAVLDSGAAVIANDAARDSRRAGLPEGHPAITSFLGLPVCQGSMLVGMIGIANRQGGYDAKVASYLDPFLSTCAALISAYRAEQEQHALETRLRESEERFHTLAESLPVMIWLAELDGRCTWFNQAWLAFSGRALADELAYNWIDDVHPDDRAACLGAYAKTLETHLPATQEFRLLRHDGKYRSVMETTAPRLLPDGRLVGLVGTCIDLTERRELEAQVEHLAYHDSLTGLANRALLLDCLAQALSRASKSGHQVAVLFLDIDRFKNINDTLGHVVGDELLREAGARLKHMLRETDRVARIGGDEFLILLPRVLATREAAQVAAKLMAALSTPFTVFEHTLYVTVSVGISFYPQDGADKDTLIKHADIALYAAKGRGRNSYQMFEPCMNAMAQQRLFIENSLRRALIGDEFMLYYQPRIDLATGQATGVEALIRWRHPKRGMIPPCDFIAVAEEIGIIGEIGDWALRAACRQARAWQAEGLPLLRMAVNVSARQLHDKDFPRRVGQILLDTQLPASCLDIELTESCVMADPEDSIKRLEAVRGLGVHFAIDDFGTGYSSLAYLKRLPVNCLKIDRSFVIGIPGDLEDVAIAQTILAMAKTLSLVVVAEGVETEAQRDFLRAHGCDEGQGYLFSKPVPAECLAEALARIEAEWPHAMG
jgi:diguanylate cyclase (GGDEF)-like protein/PAS domain S-box-containing protein